MRLQEGLAKIRAHLDRRTAKDLVDDMHGLYHEKSRALRTEAKLPAFVFTIQSLSLKKGNVSSAGIQKIG